MRRLTSSVFLVCSFLALPAYAHHIKQSEQKTMPLTTSSAKARDLYERAMGDYENLYLDRATIGWRAAAKEDPDFAVAWAWVAFNSRDPQEVAAARDKAKASAPHASPGERLMVQWIANVEEGNFIVGIAAMNDMLTMFPKDKRLLYLAGNWLMGENNYELAQKYFERALAIDKNYPAGLNDLAYAYARNRRFDKAFAAMDRYVTLLPSEPNPHDSYAEILRMSGNFEDAISQYQAALKIDPDFISSQLGLGDTYAVSGNEDQARNEYDKAIQHAHNTADQLDYSMQKAMTWVREKKFADADKAFQEVTEAAHRQGHDLQEAQAQRNMAEYQADDAVALMHLDTADAVLSHNENIDQSDRDDERSRILHYRVLRALHAGRKEVADQAMFELGNIATGTRSMIVQGAYHGAMGAVLMANEKYSEAISQLEDDAEDPGSMELLARAYEENGATDKQHDTQARLQSINLPTMEQALVVPDARSKRPQY
jgi:tetratricopeptide (TPR) repeat protein